jgi:hypothetical protein
MKTTYNYVCINDNCEISDTIRITKLTKDEDKPEPCVECSDPLKQIGISTNITHVNTQESNNIR